jgi:hypothetical protein
MFDVCNDCLSPRDDQVASEEVALAEIKEKNEKERKRVLEDLETAGVHFPVTQLEAILERDVATGDDKTVSTEPEEEAASAPVPPLEAVLSAQEQISTEDYATALPEDVKDILRNVMQADEKPAKSQREINQLASAANQENDVENPELGKGRSPPKGRTRRIWLCLAICCILLVALLVMVVLLAKNRSKDELAYEENAVPVGNETLTDETSSNNITDIFSEAEEEPTASPETEEPGEGDVVVVVCEAEVSVNENCYSRGEQIIVSFQNCDPGEFRQSHTVQV